MVAICSGRCCARCSFPPAHLIGCRFPLIAGWVATLIYVWLVGAQPPAVRTALAMTLWMLLRLRSVIALHGKMWLWCIGLIFAVRSVGGLVRQFLVVGTGGGVPDFLVRVGTARRAIRSAWCWAPVRWLHVQLGMTLLLVPMQAALFLGLTLTSLPANLWAVAIVSW
ncbi:hypothetical protein M8494_16385 [Serratia ureilytica]